MRKDGLRKYLGVFKNSVFAITVLLCLLVTRGNIYAQDPSQYGTPFTGVPDIRDVTMYQVNTRAFSSTHNFAGVTARLDSIKALGVNVIYLMPVYPVPAAGTYNSSNSPYCIRNFDSVGAEFGTLTDLRNLVAGAHSRNMAIILDFVVNQTAFSHPWITTHPSWYHHNADGSIMNFSGYPDVASLDLTNDSVRNALDSAMRFWIFTANFDGFRCDFADNPQDAFWTYVLNDLRGITTHNLILMAEGTRSTNYSDGFDYNFGTQCYYNSFKPIYASSAAVTDIDNSNTVEYTGSSGNKQILRFLTNHDVNSSDGTPLSLFGGHAGCAALFTVAAYMKGVPFVYNGEEVDFPTAITYPFTSVTIDWTSSYSAEAEYKKIIAFRNSSTAIRRGTLTSYDNTNIAAFTKVSGSETVLVMSNLRNSTQTFSPVSSLTSMTWYDAYTGASYTLPSTVTLSAYQYIVLTTVNPLTPPTGVAVSPATSSTTVGATVQLTSTVTPSGANQTVTWTTSNSGIATVNSSGLVTSVAAGTATITATTATGGFTAHSVITSSVVAVTGVNVSPTSNSLNVNGTVQLTATVLPTNASNQNVTWSSSNSAVASVSSTGLVTALTAGSANITVTTVSGSKTAIASVTSTSVAVTGVTVSPTSATVYVGSTQQLTATVAPSNATNKNVTWSSSNASVASVNSTGLVTGVAAGSATITVTTVSGGKTATSTFTISTVPTFTVHFYRPSTWGTGINVYWWDVLPSGALGVVGWPGTGMTNNGNNWYSYTFTGVTSDSLIFNDGTNQTANLYRAGTNGWYENGIWYSSAPTAVTGVTLAPATVSLSAGGTQQLTPTIAPSGAVNQNVSYASSSNSVATVSSTGLVTAIAAGTATVTVTTQDGSFTAHSVITVTGSTGFTVHYYRPSTWGTGINVYWWNVLPSGALPTVGWPGSAMTNNGNNWYSYTFTGVASDSLIFNDGSNQTANLYRNANGWYENGIWYNSAPTAVTGVAVSPTTASVTATQQLTATITPTGAVNQNVSWTSSNTGVVTVSSTGLVTAVAAGTATVTVTTQDGSFTASSVITVPSAGTTYYNIVNRWQSTTYLYDGGTGKVLYGTSPGSNTTYQWAQVSAGSGYVYLKNRSTGNIMYVEDQDGYVECGTGNTSWYSAMWQIDAAGSGWDYIENRWMTSEWIHIEDLYGYAEYAGAESGWYSAMWEFVNGVSGRESQPQAVTGTDVDAKVFPNPASGNHFSVLFKNLPANEIVTVSVRNAEGQTVLETQMSASGQVAHTLAPGMYFVSIRSKSLNVIQKLVVQ